MQAGSPDRVEGQTAGAANDWMRRKTEAHDPTLELPLGAESRLSGVAATGQAYQAEVGKARDARHAFRELDFSDPYAVGPAGMDTRSVSARMPASGTPGFIE